MSTLTRKAKNDIEFIEMESQRSEQPEDSPHCEAMISLFLQAAWWMQKASEPLPELDVDTSEELLGLAQRGLLAAMRIEASCAIQLQPPRELRQLARFRTAAQGLARLRDRLLSRFEESEEKSWQEINHHSPTNAQLLESARQHRAPQEWYDEQPDISPLEVPGRGQTTPAGRNHLGPAE